MRPIYWPWSAPPLACFASDNPDYQRSYNMSPNVRVRFRTKRIVRPTVSNVNAVGQQTAVTRTPKDSLPQRCSGSRMLRVFLAQLPNLLIQSPDADTLPRDRRGHDSGDDEYDHHAAECNRSATGGAEVSATRARNDFFTHYKKTICLS